MFEKSFIDTSVILRLLLNDNPKKRNACETLIKESKQKGIMLYVMPIAIMETVWVLERVFKFKREEIRDLVQAILNTPELKIEESDVFSKAIDDYCQKNIKFADASIDNKAYLTLDDDFSQILLFRFPIRFKASVGLFSLIFSRSDSN